MSSSRPLTDIISAFPSPSDQTSETSSLVPAFSRFSLLSNQAETADDDFFPSKMSIHSCGIQKAIVDFRKFTLTKVLCKMTPFIKCKVIIWIFRGGV